MRRDLAQLANNLYDVLIIGGGVYGLFAAWDAALRGLSVAIVDKGDFGSATSSNSSRIIHGGLRYLQYGDIRRMRESDRERTTLMRIAPHLVHPLPVLIPTYGHSIRGKEALSLALKINGIVSFGLNYLGNSRKRLPGHRLISREECLRLCPGVGQHDLTGGAVFYDCQMSSSERLLLAILQSATDQGAHAANYVEVNGFLTDGNRVSGVRAKDLLMGDALDIRARVVVNASGPWVDKVLALMNGHRVNRGLLLSKAFNLVVNRELIPGYSVGVYSKRQFNDGGADINKGAHMLFISPWHNGSLIGTEHLRYDGEPDNLEVTAEEIQRFIGRINQAYPAAGLKQEDISKVYAGLVPADPDTGGEVQPTKRYRIHDHREEDGVDGLISMLGVKFTESRHVAERVINLVFRKLGKSPTKSTTAVTPLHGGQMADFEAYLHQEILRQAMGLSAENIRHLVSQYGTEYREVLALLDDEPQPAETSTETSRVLKAEVLHAVREEMAQNLSDVIFRRTTLGIVGAPPKRTLNEVASIMSKELGWDRARARREVDGLQCEREAALTNRHWRSLGAAGAPL